MLRIGLTGSIGVGKSFVAEVLETLGCFVLDADELSRQVVMPGTRGLQAITRAFGNAILRSDGTLDRLALGAIVFDDPSKRALLNSLLHPLIEAEEDMILENLDESTPNGIAVVEAALLIETGGYKRFAKLIVVTCRPNVQLERLMARNGWTREEAAKRIDLQMDQDEKVRYADYVIDTTNGFEETREKTRGVYIQLRALANQIENRK